MLWGVFPPAQPTFFSPRPGCPARPLSTASLLVPATCQALGLQVRGSGKWYKPLCGSSEAPWQPWAWCRSDCPASQRLPGPGWASCCPSRLPSQRCSPSSPLPTRYHIHSLSQRPREGKRLRRVTQPTRAAIKGLSPHTPDWLFINNARGNDLSHVMTIVPTLFRGGNRPGKLSDLSRISPPKSGMQALLPGAAVLPCGGTSHPQPRGRCGAGRGSAEPSALPLQSILDSNHPRPPFVWF